MPIHVEESAKVVEVVSEGGLHLPNKMIRDVELILSDEDVQRIAAGRVCIYCQEPFEEAYPEECPVCCFPVRELQAVWFAGKYTGWEKPTRSMADKVAALDEDDARKAFDPSKRPQILVPRGV